jgi:small subunit ribosomal protein S18
VVETRSMSRPPMRGGRPASKWGGGKYAPKRKFCSFCADRSKRIDYKDTGMLSRFISDRGKIEPRRRTGTCNRHQHVLALAIKQARHMALLPFVPEHIHKQGAVPPLNLAPPTPPASAASTNVPAEIKADMAPPPAEVSAQT